jgi:hypothetical protein
VITAEGKIIDNTIRFTLKGDYGQGPISEGDGELNLRHSSGVDREADCR